MSLVRAWEALPSPLRVALSAGATVVTPNNRLARRLTALYDGMQRAAGRLAWEASVALPWSAWLVRLWQDAAADDCGTSPPRLISAAQSAFLWKRIVAADHLQSIDEGGLAALAADAWSTVHGWGAGGASWRGWSGGDDDRQAFVRWAEDYAHRLAAVEAIDLAQLPDWLARRSGGVAAWRGASVTLAGFIDESPQQQRLAAALSSAGTRIERCASVSEVAGIATRVSATTARDEAMRALQWARERALAHPDATVAVAFADLEARREEIRALADDVLCPLLQWPGHEETPRPYNLSLGVAASSTPLVGTALDLIALAHGPLATPRAAALLRSPYLPGARDEWTRRASVEAGWLNEGRRHITLDEAIASFAGIDDALADRWRRARDSMRPPASATSREWTEFWRAWVDAKGWPGDRPLSSVEWQARELWDEILGEFATFGVVAQRIVAADALRSLIALAEGRIFQPESPAAPVQILGGLEAAGLPFDALWIAGLAAEAWPPAPRPNPLLPLEWQRERSAPHASTERELAYARALTAQWAHGAPEVVFSYARSADDHERAVSLLVPEGQPLDARAPMTTASVQFAAAPARESIRDDRAPMLAAEAYVRGGANLLGAQSDCPFQAMARFRLGVDRWPRLATALLPGERGVLVHAALAAFWRDVRDHATLVSLSPDALAARIAAAADAALSELLPVRWRRIPLPVRAGEVLRLAGVLRAWVDGFERPRPPFSVEGIEVERRFSPAAINLRLRIDRIDRLPDGALGVIDYKSGLAKPPAAWFATRPEAPQIALYALAQAAESPQHEVLAAAYAQLKAGEVDVRGIAADATMWPALSTPADLRREDLRDWSAIRAHWARALATLAGEVREGHAAVTPRDTRVTCRACGRQALCRIDAPAPDELEEGDDE